MPSFILRGSSSIYNEVDRFTNERLSTTIGAIGLPRLARSLLTLIGSWRIYYVFKIKARLPFNVLFLKVQFALMRLWLKNSFNKKSCITAMGWKLFISILSDYYKTVFFFSISRKWKTIKVLSFSRTVSRLITRVHNTRPKLNTN